METYEGHIQYNDEKKCYGMMGHDGHWIKEALEDGDRIDIVINDELFPTSFEHKFTPVLKPYAWTNWDSITQATAVYYKSDPIPTEEEPVKVEKKSTRYLEGLFYIGAPIAYSIILGALLALLIQSGNQTYIDSLVKTSVYMFAIFGAGPAIGGLLRIMNILPSNLCLGFGCGLYYGTIILSEILSYSVSRSDRYFISFVIVALVCYIVWLKRYKPTDTD